MTVDNLVQSDQLARDAVTLLKQAWAGHDEKYGAGFMSCAVYDTAWVSLVVKEVDGEKQWLFPESFSYLIQTQSDDGSWTAATTVSQIDGILNTAASLLSLQRHRTQPLNTASHVLAGIEDRIQRAGSSLALQLQDWNVAETAHVGFEMIVPALLDLLRAEDASMVSSFAGEKVLRQIYDAKMQRFKPEILYGNKPLTALHSLEAFTTMVDFDRLAHHKAGGSMMASPSSTAAYLMNTSSWDDEAEAYLRNVLRRGSGRGSGAVPSAFPSMYFEYTWIISTMLRAGFTATDLHCTELQEIKELLDRAFTKGGGVIGFAPGMLADVDDTAKCLITLGKLGIETCPDAMINAFESDTHFLTYGMERNPSFTANCNVLSALLEQPEPERYSAQIAKITDFLCNQWWESDEDIKDKWNSSSLYPSLLVVQAFVDLLICVEKGALKPLGHDQQGRVQITMFQACLRGLLHQQDRQSAPEEMAYRVLLLCEARKMSFFSPLGCVLDQSIEDQCSRLESLESSKLDPEFNQMWVEKVSFGSHVLTKTYVLAALKAASRPAGGATVHFNDQSADGLAKGAKYVALLKRTPLFASTPEWQIQASLLEATLFQPLLRRRRLDVFPRNGMMPDKYFDLIPLTWTSCNNRSRTFASTNFLYEMMVISFLDFQADEFMEAVAGSEFKDRISSLRQLIDEIFGTLVDGVLGQNGDHQQIAESTTAAEETRIDGAESAGTGDDAENHVRETLTHFVSFVAFHPCVQSASPWDRTSTLRELRTYLHAHVTQSEDNSRMALARSSSAVQGSSVGRDGFFRWVRTTSADHTACPYSWAFAGCLLGGGGGFRGAEAFPTGRARYLAAAACQHLATMCRMYNDYGSIARDEAECNLNSVDFDDLGGGSVSELQARKETLFALAQYERGWLDTSMDQLRAEAQTIGRRRQVQVLTMFCDVTDLYGQIYVVKDIASRMTNGNGTHSNGINGNVTNSNGSAKAGASA